MRTFINPFWNDESGITSVEYALLLAFVAAGVIAGVGTLGSAVEGEISATADCMDGTTTC